MEENTNTNADVESIDTMDDLNALLDEDSSAKAPETTTTTVEEPKVEEKVEEPKAEPEVKAETPTPTDGGVITEGNTNKANQAYAAMRVELKRQSDLLQKVADSRGISLDQLKTELNKEAVEKKAAQLNVTPEVYERLSRLEEANRAKEAELQALRDREYKSQQSQLLTRNIEEVQKEYGLSDDQAMAFVNETIRQGMDILKGSVPLSIVYKGMNFDKLMEEKIEAAKQEVIAQYEKADKHAPTTMKNSGNSADKDVNDVLDMADLDRLLGK